MKPRSDVIARRFCDGASIAHLAFSYLVTTEVIEAAIRRQLNRKARKR